MGFTLHRVLQAARSLLRQLRSLVVGKRPSTDPITRISVLANGKILMDGSDTTVSEVKRMLARTKVPGAAVWYYRESGQGAPSPVAVELFKFMVGSKLPISLSSKPDFSDYIDEKGRSRPRK